MSDPVIEEVTIKPSSSPLGDTAAWHIRDGQERLLFVWYKDQIHFDSAELVGLTILEAHELRHKKHRQRK